MSSYSLLLDLPEEVRRKILIYTLLVSAAPADAHLRGIDPVIFDRPVAIIDHRFSSTTSELTFWGTSRMTDLFIINKQIYAEIIDLVYGTFAVYFPPTRPYETDMRWIKWAETNAPNLKKMVRHLQMYVPLHGEDEDKNSFSAVHMAVEPKIVKTTIDEFQQISAAFPNLVSIALQCFYPNVWFKEVSSADLFAGYTENAANWWKAKNVRVTIFPDPCVNADGKRAIAYVQDKIGQNPKPQWRI
jgi:hypothetical protein